MTSYSKRLEILETRHLPVRQYVCIIHPDHEREGYTVVNFGGGDPVHFATREELDEFGSRPGVDLLIIKIVYASEELNDQTPTLAPGGNH